MVIPFHKFSYVIITKKLVHSNVITKLCFYLSKEILKEVSKREKMAGIIPNHDIDLHVKVKFESHFINRPTLVYLFYQ